MNGGITKIFTGKRIFSCLSLFSVAILAGSILVLPVYSQQIVTDGFTSTTLSGSGNITNVNTSTIKGVNAFNSFSKFNVNAGNVVNLIVPNAAQNLVNIVKNEATNINGILNSIQNGHIGGNVFLINPYGIVVGKQGIINVGSLTAITPTKAYVDNFFDSPENPNENAVIALFDGKTPLNPEATIAIEGKINSIKNVNLTAGTVNNAGEIYTGAVFDESNIDIGDVVNINGLNADPQIAITNGDVVIRAEKDFINSGKIIADGGNNLDGAKINAIVKHDVILHKGTYMSAKGKGENSNGGRIFIFAYNDMHVEGGTYYYASAENDSGNAGIIEWGCTYTFDSKIIDTPLYENLNPDYSLAINVDSDLVVGPVLQSHIDTFFNEADKEYLATVEFYKDNVYNDLDEWLEAQKTGKNNNVDQSSLQINNDQLTETHNDNHNILSGVLAKNVESILKNTGHLKSELAGELEKDTVTSGDSIITTDGPNPVKGL